jgi:hypothetical protein
MTEEQSPRVKETLKATMLGVEQSAEQSPRVKETLKATMLGVEQSARRHHLLRAEHAIAGSDRGMASPVAIEGGNAATLESATPGGGSRPMKPTGSPFKP